LPECERSRRYVVEAEAALRNSLPDDRQPTSQFGKLKLSGLASSAALAKRWS